MNTIETTIEISCFSRGTTLLIAAVMAAISCAKEKDEPTPAPAPRESDATPDKPKDDQVPQDSTEDPQNDDEDHASPTSFTVADLLQTARKATSRYERLTIPNSSFRSVKTWKSETYAWAKLTYEVRAAAGATTEEQLFLACHFHGAELGCHKKDQTDPSEPIDTMPDDDLPPLDDDLPPLE